MAYYTIASTSKLQRLVRFLFFHASPSSQHYPLSLHDALPIYRLRVPLLVAVHPVRPCDQAGAACGLIAWAEWGSEEHTSELQSHVKTVCRVLLEKKQASPDRLRQMKGLSLKLEEGAEQFGHVE